MTSKPHMNDEYLRELAIKLAINQITNSIVDYDNKDINEVIDRKFGIDAIDYEKECRYIMIIGAGASYATSNKIPLAANASNQILETLNSQFKDVFNNTPCNFWRVLLSKTA